jgi:hypothetical protein
MKLLESSLSEVTICCVHAIVYCTPRVVNHAPRVINYTPREHL